MSSQRDFYSRKEESSSQGRGYGGGKEGQGRGGGYPYHAETTEKKIKYSSGERIFEGRSFKSETGYGKKESTRGTRVGHKSKSMRKGQRKHAA